MKCDNCGERMNSDECKRCGASDIADIVLVSTAPPWRGGIAQFVNELGKAFTEKFKTQVITFKTQYPRLLRPNQMGDKAPELPTEMILRPFAPWTWLKAIRRINRLRAKIVVMKYWHPYFALCFGFILRRIEAQSAVIIDNVMPHETFPFSNFLTKYMLLAADHIFVQSDTAEKDLHELFPTRIPIRVEHPQFSVQVKPDKRTARRKLGLAEDEKVILFFGYVRPYKGLDILLTAMRSLPDVTLVIAGEFYEPQKYYEKDLSRLGTRVIIFDKYIEDDDVSLLFSAADAVVLPYLSATQSGVAHLAIAYKTPIIASRVGDLRSIVKNGMLVDPGMPDQLASMIKLFYDYLRMNTASRFVEKSGWTFNDLAEKIIGIARIKNVKDFERGMNSMAFFREQAI